MPDIDDVAQIFAPAGDDAERRRVLDHVAGHRGIGLDIDADAGVVVGLGADRPLRHQVADDVALHDREPAALVEIADRNPDRGAIDGVVGDHRALEGEFGIQRHLADVADAVARDLDVGRRIAAHRRIIAIADAIAAHDHVAGAKRVDGVAVLSGAAGAGLDVLDAVVEHLRAVVADRGAQDFDAVVVGAVMVLRATSRPCASNETMAVEAVSVMMLPLISPETFSNQMPLPPLPAISQSVMRMSRPPRQCTRPRRVGSGCRRRRA